MYGAKNVGMFPVWYEGKATDGTNPFASQNKGIEINIEHLHIYDWCELENILREVK